MREMRDAFFEPLVEEALKDKNVIILAADHTAMSLEKMIAKLRTNLLMSVYPNKIWSAFQQAWHFEGKGCLPMG